MVRKRRKALERDSELLASAVPIMKAALDELIELRAALEFVTSERDFARLSLKVIMGENSKVLDQTRRLSQLRYDQQERLVELELELRDSEQIADEYEAEAPEAYRYDPETRLIEKYDPTREPFA